MLMPLSPQFAGRAYAYRRLYTATDARNSIHLQRIRAMVAETNYILERASVALPELAIRTAHLPGSSS
jgi:hypothetical protein